MDFTLPTSSSLLGYASLAQRLYDNWGVLEISFLCIQCYNIRHSLFHYEYQLVHLHGRCSQAQASLMMTNQLKWVGGSTTFCDITTFGHGFSDDPEPCTSSATHWQHDLLFLNADLSSNERYNTTTAVAAGRPSPSMCSRQGGPIAFDIDLGSFGGHVPSVVHLLCASDLLSMSAGMVHY